MAERKLIVQIVGNDESLHRAFTRSSKGAVAFDKNVSRAARGALAGSGAFRGLGRSIAFASGGFLAFASAGQFLRTSIDAAKEAQVTQKQLGAQFRASGNDLAKYQGAIDKTANRLSLLAGIQNDEIKAGFTTIFRTTRNVSKSLRDLATTADLARAKHLGFAQSALIVAKTEAGNTTLLRRQGFQIAKNATAEQALAALRRAVAGQARAGTTAQERFGAVLHNTEEIIGTALLPILNKYLTSGAKWLTQMNQSGRLQRDVAEATKTVGDVFHGVEAVIRPLVDGFKLLGKATGGTKNEVELLGTAFLVMKARARLAAIAVGELAGAEIAAGAATSAVVARVGAYTGAVAALGASTGAAVGRVAGLRGALLGLKGLGVITVGIEFDVHRKGFAEFVGKAVKGATGSSALGDLARKFERVAIDIAQPSLGGFDIAKHFTGSKKKGSATPSLFELTPQEFKREQARIAKASKALADAATPKTKGGKPLSLQGRFNLADFALQKAALTQRTSDDRAALVLEASITRQQIAQAKSLKDKTRFTQQLAGIQSQILSIDQADAHAVKDAALARREHVKQVREHAAAVLQTRQFRVLGLDQSGSPLTPNVRSLKKEFASVDYAVKGTFLDTGKTRSVLAKVRRLLTGQLGALTKDVRSAVKAMLDDLDGQLKDHAGGPETKFQKASTKKLLAGLGLNPVEKRALRARLSRVGVGGTVPASGVGAFGVVVPPSRGGKQPDTVIHTHVHLDGREVAMNTTRHQEKHKRRNSSQVRGPHAGGGF